MSKYIVKPVVCDYGIFIVDDEDNEELVEVCNSQVNANTICEIFNADLMREGQYTIWKDDKIAELERKLEEKDKIIETQHNGIGYWKSVAEKRPDFDNIVKIKDLEQQLAEKDAEIEGRKNLCYLRYKQLQDAHKDKIEFAIDILKQIRNEIPLLAGMAQGKTFLVNYNQFKYHIDQRIKQLKESELSLLEEEDD